VGFWGTFVVGRPSTPLADHPLIASLGGEVEPMENDAPGWQSVSVHGADPAASAALLDALVADTGAPALLAVVVDSDFAHIDALATNGARWASLINRECAADYGIQDGRTETDAAADAVVWAASAGITVANPAALAVVLGGDHTFAEEGFADLAGALGVWT
jgi:hypothetical protein